MNRIKTHRCCIVATLLALLAQTVAVGQIREQQAEANSVATIEIEGGDRVDWMPQRPLELRFWARKVVNDDGSHGHICYFATGAAGQVYYVDSFAHDASGQTVPQRHKVVVVEGKTPTPPQPGPDVSPNLQGLAKQIYELAQPIGDASTAHAIGDVYGGVASAIAAKGIASVEDAKQVLLDGMRSLGKLPKAWKPVGDIVADASKRFATDLPGTLKTFRAIEQGLKAVK